MKTCRISVILLLVVVLILPMVTASAKVTKIDYQGTECPIKAWEFTEPPWMTGNIQHMRGVKLELRLAANNEYLDGINYVTMDSEVNTLTGEVHAYGTARLVPDKYIGTGYYEGHFSSHWMGSEGWRNAVQQGFGALEGMTVTNNAYELDPASGCDLFTGTIIMP